MDLLSPPMTDVLSPQTSLAHVDHEIFMAIESEDRRQHENLELIASENYASKAVRVAMGSVLTNKYAEGYPGKRYYGGCEFVDIAESLAIARLKKLFGATHANVQAHAGAQANMAVFMAVLNPGRHPCSVCSLAHGGHPTQHVALQGQLQRQALQRDRLRRAARHRTDRLRCRGRALAREHKPKMIIAPRRQRYYPRTMDYEPFREIAADEVGAVPAWST